MQLVDFELVDILVVCKCLDSSMTALIVFCIVFSSLIIVVALFTFSLAFNSILVIAGEAKVLFTKVCLKREPITRVILINSDPRKSK